MTSWSAANDAWQASGEPNMAAGGMAPMQAVALAQGAYYLLSGVWPLVHLRSFERVSGPKADDWLVKTVGTLIAVIGLVLSAAGRRRQQPPEIALLGAGSAAGLTGIDVVYVARRRISPIYLLDAVAELGLIALWALAWRRRGL